MNAEERRDIESQIRMIDSRIHSKCHDMIHLFGIRFELKERLRELQNPNQLSLLAA